MAEVRIHKLLADAGIASRRRAEDLVAGGHVAVNGRVAQVGDRVDPAVDRVTVDGRPLERRTERVYLALNKPAGITSTVADRHAESTVVELVPAELRRDAPRLYPVGRLDRESEGLILLTNDGDWADRVLHPRYGVEREYAVGLRKPLNEQQRRGLQGGITLEEGDARLTLLRPATTVETRKLAALVGDGTDRLFWYRVVLTQGWKRQIRRMFTAVGAPVSRLVRVRLGTLWLEPLRSGQSRALTHREASSLSSGAGALNPGSSSPNPAEVRGSAPRGSASGAPSTRTAADRAPSLVVTLDGPASSGKSTVGAGAAGQLGYRFCDTGMLYRALTWLALERGVDVDDAKALVALAPEIELQADDRGRMTRVQVDGRDVTDLVRTTEVDRNVSQVSRHAEVREALLPLQRRIAQGGRIIMAGRDIGTVVLPEADLKLYLHVPLPERARRRAEERGISLDDEEAVMQQEKELRARDKIDSTRSASPLRVPEGARIIESEGNTLEQTIDAVVNAIQARAAARR
jgi:cytidylate kinase